jgi:hypothetical protein
MKQCFKSVLTEKCCIHNGLRSRLNRPCVRTPSFQWVKTAGMEIGVAAVGRKAGAIRFHEGDKANVMRSQALGHGELTFAGPSWKRNSGATSVLHCARTQRKPKWFVPVSGSPLPRAPGM